MKVTKNKLLLGLEALLLCVVLVFALRPKMTLMNVDAPSDLIYVEQQDEVGAELQSGIGVLCLDLPELSAGSYELVVSYEATEGTTGEMEATSCLQLRGGEDYFRSVLYNPAEFVAGNKQMRMPFCLRDNATDLEAYLEGTSAQAVNITGMELVRTSGAARMVLCLLLLILTPLNLLYALYRYMGSYEVNKERLLAWLGVPAIALVASIPLFTDYLIASDAMKHCLDTIENVARGGAWTGGAVWLGLPILLRKLGFTLNLAYAVSVMMEHVIVALIAYELSYLCFRKRTIACIGCLFYVLMPWRLEGIYQTHDADIWKILVVALMALTICLVSSRMLKCENKMHKNIFFTVLCGGYLLVALSYINNMMLWTEGVIRLY